VTNPAPIAIFAYSRADHTRRLLRSLLANPLALQSPIVIYCDGPRGAEDRAAVAQARAAVRELAPAHARIVERGANLGLAGSVITGVTELVEAHGEAIVLEDDLELSPVALDYFNDALARYRTEERVMHVSGYMYPVRAQLPEAFFYREATCWGWATWARAWRRFEPDAARIRDRVLALGAQRAFDVEGSMIFFDMLERQMRGDIDSWAIRWYGTLWMHGGLALHPARALVRNTGHDGTGVHRSVSFAFDVALGTQRVRQFPDRAEESPEALRAILAYRQAGGALDWAGLWGRLRRRFSR
jgi:hypothetical protein